MNKARVKVVAKKDGYSKEQRFKDLFEAFKRMVQRSGILAEYKERQYFESKSRKARRKKREMEARMHKDREK